MKTHAGTQISAPSRSQPKTAPVPHALAHQEQLRSALRHAGVQPRLEMGAVNDPLEREADRVAEHVMRMPEPLKETLPLSAQEKLVQTKAQDDPSAATASPQLESTLHSLHNGGTLMDASTRAFFEPRFGENFSQVRLHTDTNAAQMASSLNAKAFTLGNDIAFASNSYSPHTSAGKNLLGHELAHVIQQRGSNAGTPQAKRLQREGGTPSEGRGDLQKILEDYQVKSDPNGKVQWTSSYVDSYVESYGSWPILGGWLRAKKNANNSIEITATEAKMLDKLSIFQQKHFSDIKDKAHEMSAYYYPAPDPSLIPSSFADEPWGWITNDGHRDAFRHAYWNALLTQRFGEEWARQFTTAHEGGATNPGEREAMDLYNNEVGRKIATSVRFPFPNRAVAEIELAKYVKKTCDDGKLVVIDSNGNLNWSDKVPLWKHGGPKSTSSLPGKIPTPDGNAKANRIP